MAEGIRTKRLRAREARRGDEAVMRRLLAAAPEPLVAPELVGQLAPRAAGQLLLDSLLEGDRQLLLIQELSTGSWVGMFELRIGHPWPRAAVVELLLLVGPARGKGYGQEICGAWLGWAKRERGLVEVQATVLEDDARALSFWQGMGFRDTGRVQHDQAKRRHRLMACRL
jgi:RimJ/RimL family protein N-acetyltransferase